MVLEVIVPLPSQQPALAVGKVNAVVHRFVIQVARPKPDRDLERLNPVPRY